MSHTWNERSVLFGSRVGVNGDHCLEGDRDTCVVSASGLSSRSMKKG